MAIYTEVYTKQSGGSVAYSEKCLTDLNWGFVSAGGSVTECGSILRQSVITFSSLAIPITDNGTNGGSGSYKIYTFPLGLVQVLGATANFAIVGAAGLATNAAIVCSLGTDAAGSDNATLTLTEADILPSTASTLTSSAGTFSGYSTAALMAAGVFYHHTVAKCVYFNAAVPDAGITSNSTLTVTGTARITWISHGDV